MPPKRKYSNKKRTAAKKYGTSVRNVNTAARTIQAAVKRALAQNVETKKSNLTATDLQPISHNTFINVDSTVLATTQGTTDPAAGNSNNRIGDEINLKGVAFKMMLENNHRYSDTTFRIMLVRSAKGDTPTTATLFNGLSGNKMMDTFNSERYTIIFSKYVKIKQASVASTGQTSLGTGFTGSGVYNANQDAIISVSTKIVKFYVPGYKFAGKSGIIKYENASSQVKFFDYNVLIYAYGAGATSDALGWYVGTLNEYIKIMYYKDA